MAPSFKVPERCLLAQACLFVREGTVPIPNDIYQAAPETLLAASVELVRALRAKSITARAALSEAFRVDDGFLSIRDWQTYNPWPLLEEVEIDEILWQIENIDFPNSRLVADGIMVTTLYKVKSPDQHEPLVTFWDELKTKKIETAFLFTSITLSTEQLFSVFPVRAPKEFRTEKRELVGGRPPKYDWDDFFAEIIVRADLDGLPDNQATLVRDMASWCIEKWGEQPSESVLKDRTSRIFQHVRKLKQS